MRHLSCLAWFGVGLLVTPIAAQGQSAGQSGAQSIAASTAQPAAQSGAPADATTASQVKIEGFRSAHFGMTEADTRKAIEADFKLSGATVRAGDNPVQHTHVLAITMPDLVPDSGKATVEYVFGYKSQRLIEVHLTWSTAIDPVNKPNTLLQAGETLQGYFQGETFPAGQTAVNAVRPDGSVILFRGTDAAGHAVVLILAGAVRPGANEHQAQMTPSVLTLAYAADPTHPDVFQLQKGTF
jgi:hypothetical protein